MKIKIQKIEDFSDKELQDSLWSFKQDPPKDPGEARIVQNLKDEQKRRRVV